MLLSGMSATAVTARRRGARERGEALPRGAPGLIHMHVRVHESRRDDRVMRVVDRQAREIRIERTQRDDAARADVDRGRSHALGRDDARGAEDQWIHVAFG
jgi:hypothetical protein